MTKYNHKFPVIKFIYLNCGYVTHYACFYVKMLNFFKISMIWPLFII